MMKGNRSSILVLVCLILSGCENEINITDHIDQNAPFTLTINHKDSIANYTTTRVIIPVNSKKFLKVIDWCNKNSTGWQSTSASFLPDISLTQNNIRLLYFINGSYVVVSFDTKQYSKGIKKGELDFLTE
jgi:hypothetical protein